MSSGEGQTIWGDELENHYGKIFLRSKSRFEIFGGSKGLYKIESGALWRRSAIRRSKGGGGGVCSSHVPYVAVRGVHVRERGMLER